MIDPQVAGLQESFRQLIPSSTVEWRYERSDTVEAQVGEVFRAERECGLAFTNDGAIIWLAVPRGRWAVLKLRRSGVALSSAEQAFLSYFRTAALGLLVQTDERDLKMTGRIASRYSFEHVFVSRYLKQRHTQTSWTSALILSELQDLSFQLYEGQPCTSGFVFYSAPDDQIANIAPDILFEPFSANVVLTRIIHEARAESH